MTNRRLNGARWLAIAALCVGLAGPARAAYISEIYLGNHFQDKRSNIIEIAGLTVGSPMELLILDARPAYAGNVLQIMRLTASSEVMVISDQTNDAIWSQQTSTFPTTTRSGDLGAKQLNLTDSRSIWLLDGHSRLSPYWNVHYANTEIFLGPATVVDQLTFGPGTENDTEQGSLLARLRDQHNQPTDLLVGHLYENGYLTGGSWVYPMTPGIYNPRFNDAARLVQSPEPGTLVLLSAALLGLCLRPR